MDERKGKKEMPESTWFDSVIEELQYDVDFLTEELAFSCVNEIRRVMREEDVNQAELARRIGKSSPYVSKVLNYSPNMTLKSLVQIGHALECKWETPHLVCREQEQVWQPYAGDGTHAVVLVTCRKASETEKPVVERTQPEGEGANEQTQISLAA